VGLSAGLDTQARGKILLALPGIERRLPGSPVRSQTLYRLSYPGSAYRLTDSSLRLDEDDKFKNNKKQFLFLHEVKSVHHESDNTMQSSFVKLSQSQHFFVVYDFKCKTA
jgi:hypothetical protein